MTLAALIRGARVADSGKAATATPATPATLERERGGTVATVATVAVASPQKRVGDVFPDPAADFGTTAPGTNVAAIPNCVQPSDADQLDALPDPAAESRRLRARAMLAEQPDIRYAVVVDAADADPVIVALAIRDVGTGEIAIPAANYDAFALLALIERHGGTVVH